MRCAIRIRCAVGFAFALAPWLGCGAPDVALAPAGPTRPTAPPPPARGQPHSACTDDEATCPPGYGCVTARQDAMNCGPAGCRDGLFACRDAATCEPSEQCAACSVGPCERHGRECTPMPCGRGTDCPADTVCELSAGQDVGHCRAKACRRSSECAGACVGGECRRGPGLCASAIPRP